MSRHLQESALALEDLLDAALAGELDLSAKFTVRKVRSVNVHIGIASANRLKQSR